jgi:monovalent cation/proton antiporter MnhG/PhaG subunit
VSGRATAALVLLVVGGAIEVLAVVGMLAMRDVYDRLHYVGVAAFGALLVAVAILVRESFSLIANKALLVGFVLVVVGPVVSQTTARSFLIRERGDWREAAGRGKGDRS